MSNIQHPILNDEVNHAGGGPFDKLRTGRFDIESGGKKGYTYSMTHRRNNKSAKTNAVKTDPVRAAADFGIDISALIDNLKRSPEERIRRHQIALNSVEKLRRAKRV